MRALKQSIAEETRVETLSCFPPQSRLSPIRRVIAVVAVIAIVTTAAVSEAVSVRIALEAATHAASPSDAAVGSTR